MQCSAQTEPSHHWSLQLTLFAENNLQCSELTHVGERRVAEGTDFVIAQVSEYKRENMIRRIAIHLFPLHRISILPSY